MYLTFCIGLRKLRIHLQLKFHVLLNYVTGAASRLRIRAKPSSNFMRWAAEATHRQKPMYLTLHQKLACHDTDTSMGNAGGLASASGRTGPLPHQPGTHVAPREAVYRPSRFAQERDSVPPQPHFEHDTPFREAPAHAQPPSGRTSRPSARFFDSEAEYGDAGRLDAGMRPQTRPKEAWLVSSCIATCTARLSSQAAMLSQPNFSIEHTRTLMPAAGHYLSASVLYQPQVKAPCCEPA